MISALILTYQEESNIENCLRALSWCDDILVLDSFSTDRTIEIARDLGARVMQRRFDNFAEQRNFGLDRGDLRHPWILHLDADEIVGDDLRSEMHTRLPTSTKRAFRIPFKLMFQGVWLRHAGLYPSYQVRLGLRNDLRFTQVGHGQRETLHHSEIGTLTSGLLHYSFSKGLKDWFDKHNRYSSAEALEFLNGETATIEWGWDQLRDPVRRRRLMKQLSKHMPFRPALRFGYMYVLRGGFLDGAAGYSYCRLLWLYESMIDLKLRELKKSPEHAP